MSYIQFKDINLSFNQKTIFRNFSLDINKGDKIRITGKSGNGKSTLMRLLLGFETFDSGVIMINNTPLEDKDFSSYRKLFSYVNQDVTIRKGSVDEILKEIAQFSHNNFEGKLDNNLMNQFEFDTELLSKHIDQLSGGERQRLGIILAIMLNREIYLLDEVTSALDAELKKKVVDFFSKTDKTVITISHDLEWDETGVFRKVAF